MTADQSTVKKLMHTMRAEDCSSKNFGAFFFFLKVQQTLKHRTNRKGVPKCVKHNYLVECVKIPPSACGHCLYIECENNVCRV